MALIHRISRLFRADMHAVLDRIEEPGSLLKQAIRDMQEALSADQQRLNALNHELGQLAARRHDLERSVTDMDQELDICFHESHEDLAKALIKRKLEAQRYLKFLQQKHASVQASADALDQHVAENRRRLDGMCQKAEVLVEESQSHEPDKYWSAPDFTVREEDVEVAFLREKRQRSRA